MYNDSYNHKYERKNDEVVNEKISYNNIYVDINLDADSNTVNDDSFKLLQYISNEKVTQYPVLYGEAVLQDDDGNDR